MGVSATTRHALITQSCVTVVLLAYALALTLPVHDLRGHDQFFTERDPSLSYPLKPSTVPASALAVTAPGIPFIAIVAANLLLLWRRSRTTPPYSTSAAAAAAAAASTSTAAVATASSNMCGGNLLGEHGARFLLDVFGLAQARPYTSCFFQLNFKPFVSEPTTDTLK